VGAPTSTGWRYVRACVFAVVATELAALGHVLGGGDLPDVSVMITVTVFLGGSLSGLANSKRTGPQIFAALVLSQLAFHAAFQVTAHHASNADGPMDIRRMLVFHVLAALAASWLMAGGESMLFRLFAVLHRVLVPGQTALAIGLPPTWTAVVTGGGRPVHMRAGELSAGSRRGPPQLF
jgi:hypothetical protein